MTNIFFRQSLIAGAAIFLWGCSAEEQAVALVESDVPAQFVAPVAGIVIQGATLIDGNGGAPVENSVVVIEGNRITAVGVDGEVAIPDDAQIIDATGKYVLPGLLDAKSNWYWNYGEAGLRWGMTSVFSSGGRNDTGMALRDAVDQGIVESPRVFQTYVAIRGRGPNGERANDYAPGGGNIRVATPEESVEWVNRALEMDADFITFGDGDGPQEIWKAGIDVAVANDKAIVFRAMGPQTRAREACAMADGIIFVHTGNIGAQIAADEEKWANYVGLPPDAFSEMDDAKADAMIEQLIACGAYLEPDLMAADRGFHVNWARVQQENIDFLEDLPPYYPLKSAHGVIENAKAPETYLNPEQLQIRAAGFANHAAFVKRFVDAGGKIVPASDNPQTHPGLGLHQEFTAFVEDVGLTEMQAIMSATSWTADAFHQPELGRIEEGRLADVIIVNADPLADILNLRQVDMVIKDGGIVDFAYDPNHAGTLFANTLDDNNSPVISNVAWMRAAKDATWRPNARNGGWGNTGGIDTQLSPPPGIEAIMPYVVNQNSTDTEMTITGFNFVEGSSVMVDGNPIPTTVVSRTEISLTIPALILATAGKHAISVENPLPVRSPEWGNKSNPAYLLVPFAFTTAHSQNRW
jgi:imidazolonepropionase-like amidohydrolase